MCFLNFLKIKERQRLLKVRVLLWQYTRIEIFDKKKQRPNFCKYFSITRSFYWRTSISKFDFWHPAIFVSVILWTSVKVRPRKEYVVGFCKDHFNIPYLYIYIHRWIHVHKNCLQKSHNAKFSIFYSLWNSKVFNNFGTLSFPALISALCKFVICFRYMRRILHTF